VKHALTILVTAGLIACGGEPEPQQQPDPVWKSQTDMINRASEIEGKVSESADRQREQIDSQAQ
jgi:hypothetical protein